jgi:site-specific DNA-methyltransferase (adenine-specific)
VAAIRSGRNSIGNEIEPKYLDIARERIAAEADQPRLFGARKAIVT